jgi:hypothetical protein
MEKSTPPVDIAAEAAQVDIPASALKSSQKKDEKYNSQSEEKASFGDYAVLSTSVS